MSGNTDDFLHRLRQDFVANSQDRLVEVDGLIDTLRRDNRADVAFLELQRHVHSIKGQGGTFGFPLISRIAHMMEDYIETLDELDALAVEDLQAYIDRIADTLESGEPETPEDEHCLLGALPTVRLAGFTDQIVADVRTLVIMPKGTQRHIIGRELVSCGFRLSFADDALSGLDAALALPPRIVFASLEIPGFSGAELASVFHVIRRLSEVHFILLTSHDVTERRLGELPDDTAIIHKGADFAEQMVECLMKWGYFGTLGVKAD